MQKVNKLYKYMNKNIKKKMSKWEARKYDTYNVYKYVNIIS